MEQLRRASCSRKTNETEVEVTLAVDGSGQAEVSTGIGMLDHLLSGFARHGCFDLRVRASGDLHVDAHHTVEDVAIALGRALNEALGEKRGIVRMGSAYAPLDEALALAVVDLSGRGYAEVDLPLLAEVLGGLPGDLVRHFAETMALEGRFTLHLRLLAGRNGHHSAEAAFKALGRALDAASRLDPRLGGTVPSTKGTLTE